MVRLFGRCLPIICMPRKKRQSLPIGEPQATGTRHHQDEINKLFVRRVESIRVTQQGAICKRLPLQTINERHKKTKSKVVLKKGEKIAKADDTEFDCETHISDGRSKQKLRQKSKKTSPSIKPTRSRTPLEKLFNKTKKSQTPSPTPSSIVDIPKEEPDDDTTSSISSSMSSDWSTSTYPDSNCSVKSKELINPIQRRQSMPSSNISNPTNDIKHRSCVESFHLGREHAQPSSLSGTKLSLAKIKEENKSAQQQTKRNDIKPTGKSKQVLQNVRKMINDQSVQEQHFNDTRQRESVRL